LGIRLQVILSLRYHIPDDECELSGGSGNCCISPFPVSDSFKEWGERMFFLISYAVGGLTKGQGYGILAFWCFAANYSAATLFIIGNQAEPVGESFGGSKFSDIIAQIAEQAK
jgi:hypothetical protein